MEVPNKLTESARKLLAERFGLREAVFVRTEAGTHPETNRPIYLFAAVRAGKPNDPGAEVLLDEAGRPVELPGISPSLLFPFLPSPAPAPGSSIKIDPPKNDLRLGECDKFTETIKVTLPKSAAVAKADVYFLADVTFSMRPILGAVQLGASKILNDLIALGIDMQWGVGSYRDFPGKPADVFINQQPVTNNAAAVQAAIATWSASGGGDGQEGQFFALDQIAQPPGGTIGWRPGAKRILVWFGDAPAHDPICKAISGLSFDITEASVTAKLAAEQITVLAIGTTTGFPDSLDDDPVTGATDYAGSCGAAGGAKGQATRIAAATTGIFVKGIDETKIVNTIIDQIKVLLTIKNVHLEAAGEIVSFVVSITPASYGPLPADKEHVLEFTISFSGEAADCTVRDKVFNGSLNVVVDGVVAGRKPTRITVPACKYTYAVKFVCGTQSDCKCGCAPVRPGSYATEINILNPKCREARVVKRVVPLVVGGAPAGREPKVMKAVAVDRITIPPGAATMDDCCRIAEMVYGAEPASVMPLTVGFLEIISDQELHVTAVYTASGPDGHGPSIDVETIQHKLT